MSRRRKCKRSVIRRTQNPTVPLYPAFTWTCPACDTLNFDFPRELRSDEERAARAGNPDDCACMSYFRAPRCVECVKCKSLFPAIEVEYYEAEI